MDPLPGQPHKPFDALVCHQQRLEGAVCLSLSGRVDLATIPVLEQHVQSIAQADDNLIVEMSGVRYIDSSGWKALLDAARRFGRRDRWIALVAIPPGILRVLEIVGVARAVPVFPTVEEALRNLR
jgi:anti-sigma B factor antagonist